MTAVDFERGLEGGRGVEIWVMELWGVWNTPVPRIYHKIINNVLVQVPFEGVLIEACVAHALSNLVCACAT